MGSLWPLVAVNVKTTVKLNETTTKLSIVPGTLKEIPSDKEMNQFSLKETAILLHTVKKKKKKLCDCVGSMILTLLCVSGGLGG